MAYVDGRERRTDREEDVRRMQKDGKGAGDAQGGREKSEGGNRGVEVVVGEERDEERATGIRRDDSGPFVRLDVGSYSLYRESNKWPQPTSSNVVSSSTFRHGNSFPLPRCD